MCQQIIVQLDPGVSHLSDNLSKCRGVFGEITIGTVEQEESGKKPGSVPSLLRCILQLNGQP